MAGVSTVAHLRTAILEALTTDRTATHPRALPADKLFQVGLPPGLPAQMRSVRALPRPGAFVVVARQSTAPGVADELSDEHQYVLGIVISRDYHIGFHSSEADIQAAFTRVADDFKRIRAALCYPGALDRTADGDVTGIADTGLIATGAESQIRFEEIAAPARGRLLNARDSFTCRLLFDPTGTPVPAPVFVRAPSIYVAGAEEAAVGGELIADPGEVTGAHTLRGQWLRDGAELEGETGVTHAIVADDAGAALSYRATAIGSGGTVSAESNAVPVLNGGPAPLDYADFTLHGDAFIDDDGNLVCPTEGSYATLPMSQIDARFYQDGGGWELDVWPGFSSEDLRTSVSPYHLRGIVGWDDPAFPGQLGGVHFFASVVQGVTSPRILLLNANSGTPIPVAEAGAINHVFAAGQKITIKHQVFRRAVPFFSFPPNNGMSHYQVSGVTSGAGAWSTATAQAAIAGSTLFVGAPASASFRRFIGTISPIRYAAAVAP